MNREQILSTPGAERLREWAAIGPVQRAALETVMDAVWNAGLAERDALRRALRKAIHEADGWFDDSRGGDKCPGLDAERKLLGEAT